MKRFVIILAILAWWRPLAAIAVTRKPTLPMGNRLRQPPTMTGTGTATAMATATLVEAATTRTATVATATVAILMTTTSGKSSANPDLDADDLPGAAGDLADSIDDFVSLGDCVAVGLMATPPEGWMCRVIDNPTPTFDGFTMFTEGNDLSITVGTPLPGLGSPCEILQACDDAVPIALSDNFPDTMPLEFAGTIVIYGTHATGAELAITKSSSLTEDETQLIMDVLDSVQPA